MSFIQIAEIEFTSNKHCFISIPKSWNICSTNTISIFKINSLKSEDNREDNREVLMSWNGDYTHDNTLSMNGLFANKMGFNRKQQVLVTFVQKFESNYISNCLKCYLKPITENDWEILSLNSDFIESNLLNQIRVIVLGQIFPIWISDSNICVFVEAFRLSPKSNAIVLNALTEVIVSPHLKNISDNDGNQDLNHTIVNNENTVLTDEESKTSTSMMSSMLGFVKSFLSNEKTIDEKHSSQENLTQQSSESQVFNVELKSNENEILRVLPFNNEIENNNKDIINTVFISSDNFNNYENNYFISKLTHILSPFERKRETNKSNKKEELKTQSNEEKSPSKLIAEMDFKETLVLVCDHNQCPTDSVFICNNLRRQMALSITSRIFLSQTNQFSIPVIKDLILCSVGVSSKINKITSDLIINQLIRLIERTTMKMLFLCNGSLIHLCGIDFFAFNTNENSSFIITQTSVKRLSIEMSEPVMCSLKPFCEIPLPLTSVKDIDKKLNIDLNTQPLDEPFSGFNEIFEKCFNFLKFSLNLDDLALYLNNFSTVNSYSLLIYGQKGSGKSYLINSLTNKLSNSPHFVFVQYIDCSLLKGKRIESLHKSWNNLLAEALHRQPSLLVFEDLDAIVSMPSKPGQEGGAEAIYSERAALLFVSLIEKLVQNDISFGNKVAIISSSKSIKSLQSTLVQTRGKHVFQAIFELSSPDLQQRIDIISKIISRKLNHNNIDKHINFSLKDLALKCKGYLPIDLSALVERAVHNCLLSSKSSSLNDIILNENNFKAAFDGFSPINLRGFDLELKSSRKLSQIGGMAQIKKTLMETLLWPIKYPILFSKLPLKPQSSIMLFGAPGTGKTAIIEAVANECGINFIGIKGPELLSKYVGASEQSVRDLFSRAQSAKPCILFFDEFDALAPRRGHDSTGVTDRVVNQLLTQMDGVEALQTGVYVLSATSRPDLIDPALLRPGRFDKCLHCSLPNESERLEILQVLSAKLSLSSDVDLEIMASLTHNFSGADLQALLYSAQLDALHNSSNKYNKQFNNQQIKRLDMPSSESLQFIAYMPTLEKGFSRNLSNAEQQLLCDQIEALKHLQIYLPNTQIDGNNSVDILSHKHSSAQSLIAIEQKHLLSSLESTKPSINESERIRYDKIYEAFCVNRGQSFQLSSNMVQKKVTMA